MTISLNDLAWYLGYIIFVLPISKNIWIESTIVGLVMIFFHFFIRIPSVGQAFFAINVRAEVFMMNSMFNGLWVVGRCYLYDSF